MTRTCILRRCALTEPTRQEKYTGESTRNIWTFNRIAEFNLYSTPVMDGQIER